MSLEERHKEYENVYNTKMTRRVPVIIRINGRGFSKLTKEVTQPFCIRTAEIMAHVLIALCKQIDGAVFGYQFFDEINIVTKNIKKENTSPWFGNRCQKISSIAASITTYEFNHYFWEMENPPPLLGSPIFDARTFVVPDLNEALSNLIWRQQICINKSIYSAAYHALSEKFGNKKARGMLFEKSNSERIELIWEELNSEFESDFSTLFKRGAFCYLDNDKWVIDIETPVFSDNRNFIFEKLNTNK